MTSTDKVELKPCPWCGCEMGIKSNRDWHRFHGGHDADCIIGMTEFDPMYPATDSSLAYMIEVWNRRAALSTVPEAAQPIKTEYLADGRVRNTYKLCTCSGQAAQPVEQEPFGYVLKTGHGNSFRDNLDGVHPEARQFWKTVFAAPVSAEAIRREALKFGAKVIELYDDATIENDYMLDSTDCAEILLALASQPAQESGNKSKT